MTTDTQRPVNSDRMTPGPWQRLSSETIDGPNGEWIATVKVPPIPPGSGRDADRLKAACIATAEANAAAIAALPDLIKALKGVVDALNVAFERCEGDLLGVHHNQGTDALLAAEALLGSLGVQS